ncbi:MAG: amidohydrolase family protein [Verrucomicrobiota bacterium]|nr:amidohydrolase family protein [Verrucomicrobiota bacterium]MDG1891575.1 amidohydrolase family protein [Verrucomicrobiota bacterium]
MLRRLLKSIFHLGLWLVCFLTDCPGLASSLDAPSKAAAWRTQGRLIDLHQHIECTEKQLTRAVRIMNKAGIGIGVNLSGGYVTRTQGNPSPFETRKTLTDRLFPGRFLHYMNLDYSTWDAPDFSQQAVSQVEEAHRLGAAGLKEFKRLGLYLRDGKGDLIEIDDPKLDPVWKRCGQLGMPVSIHVADPVAFWLPFNARNERWTELKDHKNWWFGDPDIFPPHRDLLAALERVIERHPATTFVCVHFANNPEDLDWVDAQLDKHPNMMADLAARVPEIGRQDPEKVRRLCIKHQDRILFATDFQVYERLTLGSGGSGPPPTDMDAQLFFETHWRWLETRDTHFAHMTPIQGDWTISGIGLPASVLKKLYFDNARKLLARSMPLREIIATGIASDFDLSGDLSHPYWEKARPTFMDQGSKDGEVHAESTTEIRVLWTLHHLYIGYKASFETLNTYEPPNRTGERIGLWEKDVVEMFIGSQPEKRNRYKEFQVAPTGEHLDLALELPNRDFDWFSQWETSVHVDETARLWTTEMKIPIHAIADAHPADMPLQGDRWPVNFYRMDTARGGFIAWNPTLHASFHKPERFGWLRFR